MTIFKNRYQATKYRRNYQVVVKVCGGYTLMDVADYRVWRKQK